MRIKIYSWEFAPSWFMTVVALIVFSLFIALGRWQLDRADLKRDIQNRFLQQLEMPYRVINLQDEPDPSMAYRKIRLKGYFHASHLFFIDNKVHKGQAGYHVLQPFIIEGGRSTVLVNRGWVAADYDRANLPAIRHPVVKSEVKGLVTIPSMDGFRMGEVELTSNWPQRLPYIDIERIQQGVAYDLLPYVIWLAPEVEDFYVRDWKPVWSSPEKSEAYATQWFSFALIIFILYIALNTRNTAGRTSNE